LLIFVVAVSISIPTLARYKNYVNLENLFNKIQTWDGSVAASYGGGNGTEDDPYIISSASELAFFSKELETTNYEGKYFKLGNDIVINDGLFGYDGTNVSYESDGTKFYIQPGTTNVYENVELTGNIISNINLFKGIKDFKNERQTRKKKEPGSENKREQKSQEAPVERPGSREKDSSQKEEKKSNVTVRKIRIIKKDKND
jgi:hypothetical protein